jgi:nicotinic acid phosphoribosyltransferase
MLAKKVSLLHPLTSCEIRVEVIAVFKASAYIKGRTLLEADCMFSDFGTRRRRSFHAQDIIVKALIQASKDVPHSKGGLSGTSNVGVYYLLTCLLFV